MELLKDVQKYFPIKEFRFSQKQIIEQILSGRDVLAILPTGAGKSRCYQYPALKLRFHIVKDIGVIQSILPIKR